jgi:hypothetical protein
MKHNANLDVTNDLRVRGRVTSSLGVQGDVSANAFYVTSGVLGEAGAEMNEFGLVVPGGTNLRSSIRWEGMPLNSGMDFDGTNLSFRFAGVRTLFFSGVTVTANRLFNIIDGAVNSPAFRFSTERMGMYKAAPSLIGFAVGDVARLTIGLDGITVADKVRAEAFYLDSGLEFSAEALTIPAVSSPKTGAIYTGPDGLVYSVDPTRGGKRLSTARTGRAWGRGGTSAGNVDGINLRREGVISEGGAVMPRAATITWVGGSSADVALGEVNLAVRKYAPGVASTTGGGTLIHGLTFYLSAATYQFHSRKLNVDIEANEQIDVFIEEVAPTGAGLGTPICDVEIAWRDDT